MRFRWDDEHRALSRSTRAFFAQIADPASVRLDMESPQGWSEVSWHRICAELELTQLTGPERYGGAGFGLVEMGVVLREAGRALLCAPLLSTVLSVQALCRIDDEEAAATYLPALLAGTRRGTVAARDARNATTLCVTQATRSSERWTLDGTKDWVLDGHSAELFVVSAQTPSGTSLFVVEGGAPGLTVELHAAVDPTRRAARVRFNGTPARLLGTEGSGTQVLSDILDIARVLLAAEQVGIARACLESATEYATQREQFGRPIGSFQAVKHTLASVLMEVEGADAAAMYAAFVADHRPHELPEAACVAAVACNEAALLAAGESIQVHGGIAMTWEHSAHLYLKRATTSSKLFGDTQHQLQRLAAIAM